MKKSLTAYLIFSAILIAASSCYYDNEETLYPDLAPCDTSSVTFRGTISSLLSDNCLSCHSNSQAALNGNNIRLENHADVAAQRVKISGAIKHLPGFSPMPKNGRKLSSCLTRQIDIWIQNGAPDN